MTNLLPSTHSRRTVETVTSPRLGYMPALDGLRAVAILLVVVHHAVPGFEAGQAGVDVFFVLSGFLITTLIAENIRDEKFSRRRFYARRAIRLVPALLVTVVIFTPIGMVLISGKATLIGAALALSYLTVITSTTIFSHTWSLAIEEWFYLLWPIVLAKFFRDRLTLRQAAALVGATAMIGQLATAVVPGSEFVRPYGLLVGCALALWWLDGGRVLQPSVVAGAGFALILVGAAAPFVPYGPVPYWMAIGGAVAVIGGVVSGAGGGAMRILQMGPLVAVGVVSYEWYLVHAPIVRLSFEVWGRGSYWIVVPLSLALAFALHYALAALQSRLRSRLDRPVSVAA